MPSSPAAYLSFSLSLSLHILSALAAVAAGWGSYGLPQWERNAFGLSVCLSISPTHQSLLSLSLSLSLAILWSELLNYMRCHERTEGRERERPPGRENQKKNIYTEN